MATAKPCNKNCRQRSSPVSALILCPSSLKKDVASGPNTPDVLVTTRTKQWLDLRRAYF